MLLPCGLFVHEELQNSEIGEIVDLYDGRGRLVGVEYLSISSSLTNLLCKAIYKLPISIVFKKMFDNFGDRIYRDKVMFVVIEKI